MFTPAGLNTVAVAVIMIRKLPLVENLQLNINV